MAITVTTSTLPLAVLEGLSDKPGRMYIYMEYANVASNVPDYSTASVITYFENPLGYYAGLDSGKNFLRVSALRSPVVSNTVTLSTGQATATYLAQSEPGIAGVIPGNASFGTNSICYGAALVFAPVETDRTRDIVLARSYFTNSSERLIKTAASELFITFPLTFNSTKAT